MQELKWPMVLIILPIFWIIPNYQGVVPATWHASFLAPNEDSDGATHSPARTDSCSQGISAFCSVLSNIQMLMGKILNIFVCFPLSWDFARQAKFFPTVLVEQHLLVCCGLNRNGLLLKFQNFCMKPSLPQKTLSPLFEDHSTLM